MEGGKREREKRKGGRGKRTEGEKGKIKVSK